MALWCQISQFLNTQNASFCKEHPTQEKNAYSKFIYELHPDWGYQIASPVWQQEAQTGFATHTLALSRYAQGQLWILSLAKCWGSPELSKVGYHYQWGNHQEQQLWYAENGPPVMPTSSSYECDFTEQKVICRYYLVEYFEMGNYSGFSRWDQCNHKSSIRDR